MMIAERECAGTDVVRAGVTDEELAGIVALAGFGPFVPDGEITCSADDHPLPAAARIAASAAVLRVLMFLVGMAVVGACVLL